jgi:hypothetical protein
MATSKKYFHDHLVLLLLSINAFLALAGSIFILLKLTSSHGSSYIVQYRPSLGVDAYKTGSVVELMGLIVFGLLVLLIHALLSYRTYKINRQLSLAVLSFGVLLLVMTIVISNALLALR